MRNMATQNPRITITLTPSTHSILQELSSLTGNSMSALVGDLLASNEPVFIRMTTVLRAAKEVTQQGHAQMVEALEKAQGKLEKQLGLALDQVEQAALPLLDVSEKVSRRARKSTAGTRPTASARADAGSARRRSQPPYLTGGSGLEKPVQKPSKSNTNQVRKATK